MTLAVPAIPFNDLGKWLLTMSVAAAVVYAYPCAAQKITIRGKALAIPGVFQEIGRQGGYDMIYSPETLADAPAVDLDFREADVRQVLKGCFTGLQLGYNLDNKVITVYRTIGLDASLYKPLRLRVQNADGEALDGASIAVDSVVQGFTRAGGLFELRVKALTSKLTISYQGYSTQTVAFGNDELQVISLQSSASVLDNAVVHGYGRTTQRMATGTVGQAKGSEVGSTTAGNVLEALEGRVPGLAIRQYNGVPGSAFGMLIRERHSLSQGTDPLLVVDGVPVAVNDGYQSTIGSGSAQGSEGASVLNGIPLSAIASIEVLKGAAETAIYGSRGANGVVLLTLKTGTAGRMKWGIDVYSGANGTVTTSKLLNTRQYLALRREAVQNDGLPVNAATVPEAYLWDSTRYTNFKQLAMGRAAVRQNARVELSGGDTNTVFLLSSNYHRETAVFPGSSGDDRLSVYGHLHHQSGNRRLKIELSALASWEDNALPIQDYTFAMYLAPNAPSFRNAAGQPVWSSDSLSYLNIPALGNNAYHASQGNQFVHLQADYELLRGLILRGGLGYYRTVSEERSQETLSGQDPAQNPAGQYTYTGNTGQSELAELLAEYTRKTGEGQLEALLGVDWQEQRTDYSFLQESGYTSDLVLGTGAGAPMVTSAGNTSVYRYEAVIARLNYSYQKRYIASFSDRRDGSSRFGPGNQFGNFWALSGAWIFSEEPCCRKSRWLSFGKLRGSIGTTGNDQIGDNGYAQVYSGTQSAAGYQGSQGLVPTSFANDNLRWEVNYNSEVSVDLGFLQNKILLSATGYKDWTVNQLVYTSIASQSGLPGVVINLPADIVNEGVELSLQTYNWTSPNFRWVSTVNLTLPANRLVRFPSLAVSAYANSLAVGHSLSVVKAYHYEGVNPQTGLFQFRDVNKDGMIDSRDLLPGGNLDLHCYGGMSQRVGYKNWQLDLFFEFRVQNGINPYMLLYQDNPPGFQGPSMLGNGPTGWLNHWRQPGDHALLQKLTASPGSPAYTEILNYIGSDARAVDASFVRWKSMSLSWRLPAALLSRLSIREGQVYVRGSNLLTFTHYPVTDPETQNPTALPPTRTLAAGFQINF